MSPEELARRWRAAAAGGASLAERLRRLGLYRKNVVQDANCLFKAAAEAVHGAQRFHASARLRCARYMAKSAPEGAPNVFDETAYGGLDEVAALSHVYKYDIVVIDARTGPNLSFAKNNYGRTIYLLHQANIRHFDILAPYERIKMAAFCQSIVYKALYEGVFGMVDVDSAIGSMLSDTRSADGGSAEENRRKTFVKNEKAAHAKSNEKHDDQQQQLSAVAARPNSSFGKTSALELLRNNIIPFPYKVAKGLCPYIYKNIEFDIWFEIKRERNLHSEMNNDGVALKAGHKCLCLIKPDQPAPYVCYVQALKADNQCTVFIEELGEKRTVRYEQLQPLPADEAKPWFLGAKKGKLNKKNFPKRKNVGDFSNPFPIQNFEGSKSSIDKDLNNNCPYKSHSVYLSCTAAGHKKDFNEINLKFLPFTSPSNFNPPPVEMIVAPLSVEQNGSNGNNRDSSPVGNSNNSYSPVPSISTTQYPTLPAITNPDVNTVSALYSNSQMPTANPMVISHANNTYASSYQPMPIYCLPSVPLSSVRPSSMGYPVSSRPQMLSMGINLNVPRSNNNNGSDLPLHDLPTLRYFFNLGVEWLQSSMASPPLMPPPPPPSTPISANNNYFYQTPTTPNQLALNMQNNLTLDDTNNNTPHSVPDNNNKPFNQSQNSHRGNGKFNDFRGGRGSYNRFRRNDSERNKNYNNNNNNNFNRGTVIYNQKNSQRPLAIDPNPPISAPPEKKENGDNEAGSPSANIPFIPFPPPPLYRIPFYSMEGDNSMVPPGYPQNMMPYGGPSADDGPSPPLMESYGPPLAGMMPLPYMTFMTPPPPIWYSTPPHGQNCFPPPENGESPAK